VYDWFQVLLYYEPKFAVHPSISSCWFLPGAASSKDFHRKAHLYLQAISLGPFFIKMLRRHMAPAFPNHWSTMMWVFGVDFGIVEAVEGGMLYFICYRLYPETIRSTVTVSLGTTSSARSGWASSPTCTLAWPTWSVFARLLPLMKLPGKFLSADCCWKPTRHTLYPDRFAFI